MYETEFELPGEGYEAEGEWGHEGESLEAQLAAELLEVSGEAELDRFLGKLASSVVKNVGAFVKSPVGKALGGVLKNVAKTALPAVGGALGSMVLPGAGTAIGAKLGSLAGGLLEAGEAEQLGEAEAEYQAAQRYVRFARGAIGNAARAPRDVPPRTVVRAASVSAARRYAPSLLRSGMSTKSPWRQRRRPPQPAWYYPEPVPYFGSDGDGADDGDWGGPEPWPTDEFAGEAPAPGGQGPRPNEGRWVRRGGRIVVLGA